MAGYAGVDGQYAHLLDVLECRMHSPRAHASLSSAHIVLISGMTEVGCEALTESPVVPLVEVARRSSGTALCTPSETEATMAGKARAASVRAPARMALRGRGSCNEKNQLENMN